MSTSHRLQNPALLSKKSELLKCRILKLPKQQSLGYRDGESGGEQVSVLGTGYKPIILRNLRRRDLGGDIGKTKLFPLICPGEICGPVMLSVFNGGDHKIANCCDGDSRSWLAFVCLFAKMFICCCIIKET